MRKTNSFKNFLTDIIPYFLFAIIGFVQVRIFISNLGYDIYALNQLFIQLFSYISLVEGGVGAIVSQKYYNLFVQDEKEKICETYLSSVNSMRKVSIIIFLIGLLLSFFLRYFTNNNLTNSYMQIVFILFTLRSIIEYLNLSPRFVIQADQKLYKVNIYINIFKFIEATVQIILLMYKVDYLFILLCTIIIRIIMYYIVNNKIFNEYPWLKNLKNTKKNNKIKGIGYMYYHKIAGAIYNNVDIILISAKLSSFAVTIYSSYNYICKYISDAIYMLGNSIVASLGNVMYKENNETSFTIFEELNAFFIFIATFICSNFIILSNNFISIWIGKQFIVDSYLVFMFSIILYISITKRILALVCEAKGLYKETKNIVIIEAILNLIFSILLISNYKIKGALFATIIAHLFTTFWYYPFYVYKKLFNRNSLSYYGEYFKSMIIILLALLVSGLIDIYTNSLLEWIIFAIVSSIISLIIILLIFYISSNSFERFIKKIILMIGREKK